MKVPAGSVKFLPLPIFRKVAETADIVSIGTTLV